MQQLGLALGGVELSQSLQHNLKTKSCPSQGKEAQDSNKVFTQMHVLPPVLPAHQEIGKKDHAAICSLGWADWKTCCTWQCVSPGPGTQGTGIWCSLSEANLLWQGTKHGVLDEQPHCGVVDGLPGHGPSGIHHREPLLFFLCCALLP